MFLFCYYIHMFKKKTQTLSYLERMDLLGEAIEFFENIDGEFHNPAFAKAKALATVREWLLLYQDKMLNGKEPNEKQLKEWLLMVIDEELVNHYSSMIDDDMCKTFYLWGFGLALGIMNWKKDAINWLKKLIEMKENLPQKEKTLRDLLY